ncbi:hypothetical protein Tco_0714668, partial [Tanacetum coccineum]
MEGTAPPSYKVVPPLPVDASVAARMYKDMQLFQDIEKAGVA